MWNALPAGTTRFSTGTSTTTTTSAANTAVQLRALSNPFVGSATGVGSTAVGAPRSLSIDSTGQFAYVTTGNDTVVRYAIGADGSLSAPAVTATGVTPVAIALR